MRSGMGLGLFVSCGGQDGLVDDARGGGLLLTAFFSVLVSCR